MTFGYSNGEEVEGRGGAGTAFHSVVKVGHKSKPHTFSLSFYLYKWNVAS
jgi:hypothetical protein